jgi:hypothetical protein
MAGAQLSQSEEQVRVRRTVQTWARMHGTSLAGQEGVWVCRK